MDTREAGYADKKRNCKPAEYWRLRSRYDSSGTGGSNRTPWTPRNRQPTPFAPARLSVESAVGSPSLHSRSRGPRSGPGRSCQTRRKTRPARSTRSGCAPSLSSGSPPRGGARSPLSFAKSVNISDTVGYNSISFRDYGNEETARSFLSLLKVAQCATFLRCVRCSCPKGRRLRLPCHRRVVPADKSPAFGGEVLWASESNCLAFTAAPAGRVYTVLLLSGGISGSCFLLCREGSFLDTRPSACGLGLA